VGSSDREKKARAFLEDRFEDLLLELVTGRLYDYNKRRSFVLKWVDMIEDYEAIKEDGYPVHTADPRWQDG